MSTYNENLQQNNAELEEILAMAKALPAAGDGGIAKETDPTVYDFAKKELFSSADLQDPGGRNSIVTIDGVEYYRYHASSQNFIWENPHPKAGSVKITARLVSQYAPETVDTSRLIVHYSDGTTEYLWAMKAEPQTLVTNAAKTFVKLTGNYDLENWVLLDLSVMSVEASYVKGLPNALTFTGAVSGTYDGSEPLTVEIPSGGGGGASGDYIPVPTTAEVGQTIRVSAVDDSGKPTEWEAADFPGGGDGGGSMAWKLLADVTLEENEVAQVDITEDMDGNALSYDNIYVVFFGVGSQNSGVNVSIACTTNPSYPDAYQGFALAGNCLSSSGVWGAVTIEHISGLDWKATAVKSTVSSAAAAQVQVYDGLGRTTYANWAAKPDGPIRKVMLHPFGGTFSAGFRAILYGR